jgi:dsRNA-specific ribonuclease
VIAYIYLDCGVEQSSAFIDTYIYSVLDDLEKVPGKSAKSRLQERVQKKYKTVPVYTEEVADTDEK